MKVFRALLLIATPVSASGLDYDCSFRQLAYTYADKIVGSTRPATSMDRIAAALDLSDNATHPQPDGSAQLTWAGEPTNELRASSWIECPGTQSIQGGTCNNPQKPCEPGSGNFNAGPVDSLQGCEALCLASAANFSCRGIEWHGSGAGAWARVCVLQQIASFAIRGREGAHNAACLPGTDFPACVASCGAAPPTPPAPPPAPPSCQRPARHAVPTPPVPPPPPKVSVWACATLGDDRNDGSKGHPVRTLPRVQAIVHSYPRDAVTVQLRGTFQLNETLEFTYDNTFGYAQRWTTAPGATERATISGGLPLDGLPWAKASGDDGGVPVWRAALPAGASHLAFIYLRSHASSFTPSVTQACRRSSRCMSTEGERSERGSRMVTLLTPAAGTR